MMMRKIGAMAAVALAMVVPAQAQNSIGVNLSNPGTDGSSYYAGMGLTPTDVAGVVPQANWNNWDVDSWDTIGPLYDWDGNEYIASDPQQYKDSAGNPIDLAVSYAFGGNTGSAGGSQTTADNKMMSGVFQVGGSPDATATISMSSVPYDAYEVIAYMPEPGGHSGEHILTATDGTTTYYIDSSGGSDPYVESTATSEGEVTGEANYVTFSGLSGDTMLTFSNNGNGWKGGVAGLQIVEVIDALDGDYNDDAFVGQGDLDLVLLNWGDTGGAPEGWVNDQPAAGDLIGQGYLDKVLLNWGEGTAPTSSVPEPLTMTLLGLGGLGVLARRRRRS